MKEVAGGAACLVDPGSVDSIRAGLLRVIGDSAYRQRLVDEGFRNVRRYDVETIARQYLDCYNKII
jgi:glycosyltransferase involved in cell wall biosynthesis